MIEKELTVRNRAGLHTRPAAGMVKLASTFKCDLQLVRDGFPINAKSIIGVMTLAAEQGCVLLLKADGDDEQLAVEKITEYFEDGFGEL